jgi:Ca-activated chloride channel homolog
MTRSFAAILAIMAFAGLAFAPFANSVSAQDATRERTTAVPSSTPPPPVIIPEEEDIIRVDTELVNLNVRVVDRNNRPINNLAQREFSIFEDGVQQSIEFFSQSEVPTNYSLVIDNSGSLRAQINDVIEASKIIVNTNRPGDETSVVRFVSSDKIEILQDFTENKDDLDYALENLFIEGGRTAIIDAVYLAVQRISQYESTDRDPKRRALILVSDGEDVSSYYNSKQLLDLLKESDVQIYAVGFINDLDDKSGFISKSSRSKARSFLTDLATQTGGKAYFPNSVSELPNIARDIGSEMRSQYSIGYIPTNDKEDGTYRNIRVVVNDGPNKEKRIPVTRAGRVANPGGVPSLQRSN